MTLPRKVRLRSFAKINLDLRVLHRRPDGFHQISTVFQTISLADRITVEIEPAARASVELKSNVHIEDNLIVRAAQEVIRFLKPRAAIRFTLDKQIPLGGGLGGGSTNAATVLMSLPSLLGNPLSRQKLESIAARLGSDVPFFLFGGTALGLGRGTELVPLAEPKRMHGVLVTPGIHVSTPAAYRALNRQATAAEELVPQATRELVWSMDESRASGSHLWLSLLRNDFEPPVFKSQSEIARIHRTLQKTGALAVRMSGSGSTVFALFRNAGEARSAASSLAWPCQVFHSVSRSEYLKQFRGV